MSFSPMWHWTEHNIKVHVFTCVLDLSVRALLRELAAIGETVLLYQGERGRPKARRMLTERNRQQHELHEIFSTHC